MDFTNKSAADFFPISSISVIISIINYSHFLITDVFQLVQSSKNVDESIDPHTMQLIHHPLSVLHSLLVDVVLSRLFLNITSELTITGSMTKYIHNHKVQLIRVQLIGVQLINLLGN